MSYKDLVAGYQYTGHRVVTYGNYEELKKAAKKRNKKLWRQHRLERFVVYPVPGCMPGVGQVVYLY